MNPNGLRLRPAAPWCLASLLIAAPALADDAGVALIGTAPARHGSLLDIATAYGTATTALEGGSVISLPQDGRVAQILVTPGDRLRAGDRLLVFDLTASVVSTYQQAVSSFALADGLRAHTAQLRAQKLATRDQLAQAEKAATDARAVLDALRRQGADRPRTDITAPYDSVVNTIPVAQGDRVAAGAPLLTLTRLDNKGIGGLVVTVGVEPAQYARVRPGQSVILHPLGGGADLPGQVVRIDGMLNVKTRLVDVDIVVPPASVLAGETFAADITLGTMQGWLVPHGAVLSDDKGDYLFQVDAGKAVRVEVREIGTQADTDLVAGTLDAARPIVTDGATQLAPGDPVRNAPEGANGADKDASGTKLP